MIALPKKIRKQASEVIDIAYERELNHHLNELANKFDEWRHEKIDCWDLKDFIHKFHDGASRDLYKIYNYSPDKILLIARAVVRGYLLREELTKELFEVSKTMIAQIEKNID